jgi:hypothetical protein
MWVTKPENVGYKNQRMCVTKGRAVGGTEAVEKYAGKQEAHAGNGTDIAIKGERTMPAGFPINSDIMLLTLYTPMGGP